VWTHPQALAQIALITANPARRNIGDIPDPTKIVRA